MSERPSHHDAEPRAGSAFARPGERVDDLQRDGMTILQRPDAFRFGTDAVLLADFAPLRPRDRVADLGTGTGVLCLLMAARERTSEFDAIELQDDMADMARRSVAMNGLTERIRVYALDMRLAARTLGYSGHTLVVCNPPYSPAGTALPSADESIRRSRHAELPIEDVALSGAQLLKNGGRMALIYPAARALELMRALEGARLAPKRIRIVQDRPGAKPKLILLDAVKGGRSMLHWLPPLILRDEDGRFSLEWHRIYDA
ncbi:tRNA1(Val) (adenine(37)-N6)-methyltransferase [Bacillota bacterium Meth-B3]